MLSRTYLNKFLDVYIYSSLHISVVATLFATELSFVLNIAIDYKYLLFVFTSTLLVYSVHKIIGLNKTSEDHILGRYSMILSLRPLIILIAFLSFIGLALLSYSLLSKLFIAFMMPIGLVSILYVIPLFAKKRLRDFAYIKIFLIAMVWAYIGFWSYINKDGIRVSFLVFLALFLERYFYIMAVTIPFDIRDKEIDSLNRVRTLATYYSKDQLRIMIVALLILSASIWSLLFAYGTIALPILILIILTLLLSYKAISVSCDKSDDRYFSGLLDGMIGLRSLIIIGGYYFLS